MIFIWSFPQYATSASNPTDIWLCVCVSQAVNVLKRVLFTFNMIFTFVFLFFAHQRFFNETLIMLTEASQDIWWHWMLKSPQWILASRFFNVAIFLTDSRVSAETIDINPQKFKMSKKEEKWLYICLHAMNLSSLNTSSLSIVTDKDET